MTAAELRAEADRVKDLETAVAMSLTVPTVDRAIFIVHLRRDREMSAAVVSAYALGGKDAVRVLYRSWLDSEAGGRS